MRSRDTNGAPGALIRVSLGRRRALAWALMPAAQLLVPGAWAQAARIASARVWPAQEYTRLILESTAPLAWQVLALKDPERIVLDIDGIDVGPEIAGLAQRVHPNDPHLAGIRYGRKSPTVLRLVLDLKDEVVAQAFALKPVAEFGHRLVLDLIPATPPDPLMALLDAERTRPEAPAARGKRRRGSTRKGRPASDGPSARASRAARSSRRRA